MNKFTKLFFAAIFLLTISACDKKSCTKVVCASYQTCYQGICLCPDGYEGVDCSTISSTKYTTGGGGWNATENCGAGNAPNFASYSVYMSAAYNDPINYIIINNLLGYITVTAEILNTSAANEGNTIYIPQQSQGGIQILASYGYYTPPSVNGGLTTITITLNYVYQGISYTCQENLYKQ